MNGRTRTTSEEQAEIAAEARHNTAPTLPAFDRLQLPSSRQSPGDYDYSSPSNYPSPSPGLDDESSRPESSAQGAARYGSNSPPTQTRLRLAEYAFLHDSSPSSNEPQPRPIDHTNDTFGRTSGKSALSESRGSSSARRKTSPTERSAFGYLASSWIQPTAPDQTDEITEYLSQGSRSGQRQQRIDALEKQLNLSGSSSPMAATNSGDDESMWTTGAAIDFRPSATSLRQNANPSSLAVAGSDTPERTFGRPSNDRSQPTTYSSDSRLAQATSRPSQSETTSSRDTDRSNDAAYGVGEAGGYHQFSALTRTLTPGQRLQQEELERMSQQRGLATPASTSTALGSRLASPLTTQAGQRASHHSNATVMATTTTGTSASLTSHSTPRHEARFSRQTQETTSSGAARPVSSSEQYSMQHAIGQQPLFVGDGVSPGSESSIDVLNEQVSPQLAEGMAPARSASVRVKTPMFGNTLADLPPEQRASYVGALHERGSAPNSPAQQQQQAQATRGTFSNFNAELESQHARNAQYNPQQGYAAQQRYVAAEAPGSYAYHQQPQAFEQQQQDPTTRGYYMQPAQAEGQPIGNEHGFMYPHPAGEGREDAAGTPHLPTLGDMYAVAPKFPPAPYSKYRDLRLTSRIARMHHTVLPLLTYAHIPATLFLDYNVIFALVQVALHPDTFQTGIRTAWWVATGVYGACVLAWIIGVVIIYEGLWSYRRRWTVSQPLVMPIYLSSPAFVRTAIKDYSLYSLLYRARTSGSRRDALIESFWYFSQNWPTVALLVPRGVISVILLVLYKPSGPVKPTQTPRDPAYFNQDTERFTQFAFILITFQAAWAAWKLGVLLIANVGLAATLGFTSLVQQEQDRNAIADTEMVSFAGHSRRGLVARQFGSQAAGAQGWDQDREAIQQATHRRWAWRWRAEDRIRAILFDAGLLHQPLPMQDWHYEPGQFVTRPNDHDEEHAGDRTVDSMQAHPTTYGQPNGVEGYGQQDAPRGWYPSEMVPSPSQTGLALTSPEAVQPEMWAATQTVDTENGAVVAAPAISEAITLQHFESSPSNEGDNSDASDPYSPAPLPIGRSPRSKEQLRDASSISSRADRASMRASSISSLNRLAALNVASNDSPLMVETGTAPLSTHQSQDQAYGGTMWTMEPITRGSRTLAQAELRSTTQAGNSNSTAAVPALRSNHTAESSGDSAILGQWRGRKRPRSSPVLNYFPGIGPQGMVAETEHWLQDQIDEDEAEEEELDDQRDLTASKKPEAFDNDRRIMHTFVPPMPASFAMSKDPSFTGSPEQGGSDTKHGSWTAAAPNPEIFAAKPATSTATLPLRQPAGDKNASSTSLGSSVKGRRSGTYSRPRSSGHGHEASSEDGVSFDGVDGGKKRGRNSLLSRMTQNSSSDGSRRSGSAGRNENESWIAALFGVGRSNSRKVSATAPSSSPQTGGPSSDLSVMQPSSDTPRSEMEPPMDAVPTVITTSASTTLPTADSGSVGHHDAEHEHQAKEDSAHNIAPGSLLLAPIGAAAHTGRSASPAGSQGSNASGGTSDSEEGRLWASFPDQSRRHPPGLIALDIEQQTLAERRLAAAASENNAAMQQHRLLYGSPPSLPGSTLNMSPLLHPNVLAAVSNGSPMVIPGVLGGVGISPSEGGLHAIREESWSSSLDSRSQGATGSTRSRGTASALTASPVDADFPLEQIEEVAVPHSSLSSQGSRNILRHQDSR